MKENNYMDNYNGKNNYRDTYSTDGNRNNNIGTLIKAAGLLGLGYLAYRKRDTIQGGYQAAKTKTVEVGSKISQNVKDTTSQFQDYIQNKTQDANAAVTSLTSQIEDKYHQLEGESKESYAKALKVLSDKINSLSKSANSNTTINSVNHDNHNSISGTPSALTSSNTPSTSANKPH